MSLVPTLRDAWRDEMTNADRVRVALAFGFPLGALGHFWWVGQHGLFYHGPAPAWAVWFWYGLCVADFIAPALLLTRPRVGIAFGAAEMAFTMVVNWTQFPTFELGPNPVLLTITAFGLVFLAATPFMWRGATWRLTPSADSQS